MDRKDLFNALNFVIEGFLHACGDTPENIKIAREELQQTCDDWSGVLQVKTMSQN